MRLGAAAQLEARSAFISALSNPLACQLSSLPATHTLRYLPVPPTQRNLPRSTVLSSRTCSLSACACRPQPVLFSVRRSQEASPGARSDASAAGLPGPAQDNSVKVVVRVRPLAAAEAGEREALQVCGF